VQCRDWKTPRKSEELKIIVEKTINSSNMLIVKNVTIAICILCLSHSYAESLINDKFWEIQKEDLSAKYFPGSFVSHIRPFDQFLNSVARYENGTLETYLPSSLNNPFSSFEPGKAYFFDLKESINTIYVPEFNDGTNTQPEDYPWFIYQGTSPVELNLFDSYLIMVTRYDNPISGVLGYSPGDAFPLMTTFESGGRYIVASNQQFLVPYSVPEPSALSLLAIGLSALAMMRRRRS
jgi:hypothetical protein